jgi:tetratricopeptide (TPR) repeat protein
VIALAARGGSSEDSPTPPPKPELAKAPDPPPAPSPPPPAPTPPPKPAAVDQRPAAPAPVEPPPPPKPKPRPPTINGKRVVVEYDNAAHKAEAAKTAPVEDANAVSKARTQYNLGNQRLFAGDANGAVTAYRAALATFPGYVAGYRGLGLAYMQLGNNAEAAKALQTYVRAAPNAKDTALIKKRIAHLQHH